MTSKWLDWTPQSEPAKPTELAPFNLCGHAVEFDRNGARHFLVADDADAQRLIARHGASRGEIWTLAEVDLMAAVPDQAARDEIAQWKRTFNGILRPDSFHKPHFRKETKRR
jgi:hypothetical protein